ncbi:MAG: hypothetical protein ACREYD_16405 [Casimicrobiaceae bacterium]
MIGKRERLAHLPQCLPDATGELGRVLDVLDVLLDQLPPIGAQRGVDEFDGGDAAQVDRPRRPAQGLEGADHVLLPPDDVERGQLPQPRRRRFGALQRIARVLAQRSQKSKHRFHRTKLEALALTGVLLVARAGRLAHGDSAGHVAELRENRDL